MGLLRVELLHVFVYQMFSYLVCLLWTVFLNMWERNTNNPSQVESKHLCWSSGSPARSLPAQTLTVWRAHRLPCLEQEGMPVWGGDPDNRGLLVVINSPHGQTVGDGHCWTGVIKVKLSIWLLVNYVSIHVNGEWIGAGLLLLDLFLYVLQ